MTQYTLRLSEHELNRYRRMAELAWDAEGPARAVAGIGAGARIVDIGCGPGLPLQLLADAVGPEGHVVGVDQSDEAVETATALSAGKANVEIRAGEATATDGPMPRASRTCSSGPSTR